MGKPLIVIAIPTGRPLTDGKLPPRVLKLAEDVAKLMPEFEVNVSHSHSPREAHALNMLIDGFLNQPRGVWFVWWNFAVEAEASHVAALINSGQAICGSICTAQHEPDRWDGAFYPDILPNDAQLLPVAELGGNLKVFHRGVFDIIEKNNPGLSYVYDNSGRAALAFCEERLVPFGEYNRLLAPANSLDALCRASQLGIWAHAGLVLKRREAGGVLEPQKEPYRSWLFKREPPPVCAEDLPAVPTDPRPILVIVQYCYKDRPAAERLVARVVDLGHTHVRARFSWGTEYPAGPNKLALDLIRTPPFTANIYKAVLLMEPDCCPLAPDWLDQLSADWDRASAAGKLIMGSWHPINADHPTLGHLNGNMMFSPKLRDAVKIPDVPNDKPWDTWLAATFAPFWARTGLIKNLNRHRTATTRQLTTPECGTKPPVLMHGISDESAWKYAATLCATNSSSPATEKTSSG